MLKQIKNQTRSFLNKQEDHLIHVIKTGFTNTFMVIHENAYPRDLGKVEILSSEELLKKYNLKLSEYLQVQTKVDSNTFKSIPKMGQEDLEERVIRDLACRLVKEIPLDPLKILFHLNKKEENFGHDANGFIYTLKVNI